MKLFSFLFATATLSVQFAQTQDTPLSEQLLKTLDAFSSSDPAISALVAKIESISNVIDVTGGLNKRSLPTPADRSNLACQLLSLILPNQFTDSKNKSSYNVLKTKNWCGPMRINCQYYWLTIAPGRVIVIYRQLALLLPTTRLK